MRYLMIAWLAVGVAGPALAQSGGGLSDALDRQEQQRALQQSEMRRETERRSQELQRQLDRGQLQEWLNQQLNLRPPISPCPTLVVRCTPGL